MGWGWTPFPLVHPFQSGRRQMQTSGLLLEEGMLGSNSQRPWCPTWTALPPALPSLSLRFSRLLLSVSLGDWTLSFIAASPFGDLRTPRSSQLSLMIPGHSFLTSLFLCSVTCVPLRPLLPACPPRLGLIARLSWPSPACSCENKQRPRAWGCQRKGQRQGLKPLSSLLSVRRG